MKEGKEGREGREGKGRKGRGRAGRKDGRDNDEDSVEIYLKRQSERVVIWNRHPTDRHLEAHLEIQRVNSQRTDRFTTDEILV
jgi:hypothetical protein